MIIQYFITLTIISNMRKPSLIKEDQESFNCAYCGETAELMCSKCEEIYYCKYDHQRIDWNRHKNTCKSFEEKRQQHFQSKRQRKSEIFEHLSRPDHPKPIDLASKLVQNEQQFLLKSGGDDIEIQIELGSSVCLYIRCLIASKEFSSAQDILSDYFKQKNAFLNNTGNICSRVQIQNMDQKKKEREIYLISGKLRLISTLANLMHELIRNSVDMFEILIMHTEKVYGPDSLELSNVYFYTANYLNFLNQGTKALACFLKCAKIRKNKGGTAYYNVALLLLKAKRKKKALQYFQKSLELVQQQRDKESSLVIPQIFENIALIYLDMGLTRSAMDYFEKAYFFYYRIQDKPKAEKIMKLFLLIRQQSKTEGSQDMKMIEFAKQKKQKKPNTSLSSKNYQNFKNADKIAEEDKHKTNEWISSFKELKLNYNQPSPVKYPTKQLEYLFGTEVNKNGDDEAPSYLINNSDNLGVGEGVSMDLPFMKGLTSNEVGYLHQLNRLLMECKERAAIYDIIENSNFYQAVDKDKLNKFYKLNPQLVRPSDLNRRMLLLQKVEQDDEEYEFDAGQPYQKPFPPKLDLTKLKQNNNS